MRVHTRSSARGAADRSLLALLQCSGTSGFNLAVDTKQSCCNHGERKSQPFFSTSKVKLTVVSKRNTFINPVTTLIDALDIWIFFYPTHIPVNPVFSCQDWLLLPRLPRCNWLTCLSVHFYTHVNPFSRRRDKLNTGGNLIFLRSCVTVSSFLTCFNLTEVC